MNWASGPCREETAGAETPVTAGSSPSPPSFLPAPHELLPERLCGSPETAAWGGALLEPLEPRSEPVFFLPPELSCPWPFLSRNAWGRGRLPLPGGHHRAPGIGAQHRAWHIAGAQWRRLSEGVHERGQPRWGCDPLGVWGRLCCPGQRSPCARNPSIPGPCRS